MPLNQLPSTVDPQPILPISLLLQTGDDSDDEFGQPIAGSSSSAANHAAGERTPLVRQ